MRNWPAGLGVKTQCIPGLFDPQISNDLNL